MTSFIVLFLAYTLSQFYRAFLAIITADLDRDLGLNAADLGFLSAAWFAAFAVGQFPVGWALDRFGPRRTIALFMLAAVAGATWLAGASGRADALAAMALIGLGCAPVLMGSLYLFARSYPPERFAILASTLIGLGGLGNLLGATPLAYATQAFGWRPTMLAIATLTAVMSAMVAGVLRDPPALEQRGEEGSLWSGFAEVLGTRGVWPILPIVFVSYAVVIAIRSLWIAPFLGEVHGFDALQRGNAALLMGAAMAAGALAYGPLERVMRDPKRTVLWGSVVTAAALLVLGVAGHASAALALALLTLVGATGLTYGILMAHARRFFPARLLGRGVTFMNFAFIGGAGLIQALSGIFVHRSGLSGMDASQVYARLHLAFGAMLLAAALVYAFAPRNPPATAGSSRLSPPPGPAP